MSTRQRRGYAVLVGLLSALLLAAVAASNAAFLQDEGPGLVAFETPSGIHLIRTDGTDLERLRGTRPRDQNPRWSPNGRRLVFWRGTTWDGAIYVADADGSNRRLLTRRDGNSRYGPSDQFPAWSPDGRLIAFQSFRSGAWHIWVMRPDGTRARRLTPDGRGGWNPDWSPDGKRLVYLASWAGTSLAVVDLFGRTRPVKTLSVDRDWAPSWSRVGSGIAFASTYEHAKPELYVVSANGGAPRRLTRNTASDLDPAWSPDGQHILFDSGRDGLDEIYLMRADGSDQRRVTRIPTEYACCADWKPEP